LVVIKDVTRRLVAFVMRLVTVMVCVWVNHGCKKYLLGFWIEE